MQKILKILLKINIKKKRNKIKKFIKKGENKYNLKKQFEEEYNKIHLYDLPHNREELQQIFDKMTEINNKLLAEKQKIEDFNVNTMKKEKEEILKRFQ